MKRTVVTLLVAVTGVLFGWSQPPIPDHGGRWVVDEAGVLSENTISTVTTLCRNEFDSTSNQVVVYLFTSLGGASIESYANEVYNTWEIGTKENNNGVLLVVAVNDRKMRIEVGYGLEPYLTDIEAKDIIDYEIKPEFKKGDFDNGVLKGVQNIIYAIQNTYVVPNYVTQSTSYDITSTRKVQPGVVFAIVGLVWIGLSICFSRMKMFEGLFTTVFCLLMGGFVPFMVWPTLYVVGLIVLGLTIQILLHYIWKPKRYWKFFSNSNWGGGSWSGSSSSYNYNSSSNNSSSYSSGGSSFSGGGGSSGGGGASGSW